MDISYATMIAAGDRTATARAIREIVDSGTHSWKAASSGYCTAAQLPCSFPSIGTPGRVNAVYPNGDNMRDIPDYTEFVPEWVWRYYEQSGDGGTLADSYDQLKSIANYLKANVATTGNAAGLIYNLFGGTSSYQYGIIDWPAQMRYGYTFNNNAARTIHNAEAVGAWRATAKAARALGHPEDATLFDGWADALAATMNAKLIRPSDGLYTDGLSSAAGNPQIDNTAQHAQTYPIYYGIAPAANKAGAAGQDHRPGHEPGPDDLARAAEGARRLRPLRPGRQAADRRERRRPGAHARPSRARSCGSSGTPAARPRGRATRPTTSRCRTAGARGASST